MSRPTYEPQIKPARDTPALRTPPARGRLPGLDAVRALAIAGMIYVHVAPASWLPGAAPESPPTALSSVDDILRTRSMSLFVLLAGVSVALMTGGATPYSGSRRTVALKRLAVRALVLLLIGQALEEVVPKSSIIIGHYGIWLLLLIPLAGLRARTLFIAAAVTALVGPVLALVIQNWGQNWFFVPGPQAMPVMGFDFFVHPLTGLSQKLFGPGYPITYTFALLLAGLAIGRLPLHSAAVRRPMIVWGAAVAVSSSTLSALVMALGGSAVIERFTAGLPKVMQAGGTPVFPWISLLATPPTMMFSLSIPALTMMIGVGLLLVGGLVSLLERVACRRLLAPLALTGTASLTWYSGHLLFLKWIDGASHSFLLFIGMLAFAVGFSVLWRRWVSRGPLEWLVHKATVQAVPERPRRILRKP